MDKYDKPQKPFVPKGTSKQTTESGPHGGGTLYNQLKVQNEFIVISPIKGHSQQSNIKK